MLGISLSYNTDLRRNMSEYYYYLTSTKSDRRELFSIPVNEHASFSHQARTLKADLLQFINKCF